MDHMVIYNYITMKLEFSYIVNCRHNMYAAPDNNNILNVTLSRKCLPTPGIGIFVRVALATGTLW